MQMAPIPLGCCGPPASLAAVVVTTDALLGFFVMKIKWVSY